jgi:hypothetical protein
MSDVTLRVGGGNAAHGQVVTDMGCTLEPAAGRTVVAIGLAKGEQICEVGKVLSQTLFASVSTFYFVI